MTKQRPAAFYVDIAVIVLALILIIVKFCSPAQKATETIYPTPLRPGDKIAIIANQATSARKKRQSSSRAMQPATDTPLPPLKPK